MKVNLKKRMCRFLAVALTGALMTGIVPRKGTEVYAYSNADNPDAITLGSSVLREKANQDGAQMVMYGGRDWYVVAYDGKDADGDAVTYQNPDGNTANLYPEGTITLFQKGIYEKSVFHDDEDNPPYYYAYGFVNDERDPDVPSKLHTAVDSIYVTGDTPVFSAGEQAAMQARNLAGGCPHFGFDGYDKNTMAGKGLDGALVWPVSVAEAESMPGSIRGDMGSGPSNEYWLRTPGDHPYGTMYYWFASNVKWNGDVDPCGDYVIRERGVRPAFYLNMESVLFTTASYGGKVSGKLGSNALKQVTDNTENEWTVTLKDDAHKNFAVGEVTLENCRTVKVAYSGAATGSNEYISAIVMNEGQSITQYGRLKACSSDADASGEVEINLKNKIRDGDTLCIFNEQYNGDGKTDFASSLQVVAIPDGGHDLVCNPAKDPKCEEDGSLEYWQCDICGACFKDEDGKQPIALVECIIPATGHDPVTVADKATPEADGKKWQRCSVCSKDLTEPETVNKPAKVTIVGSRYTGSAVKPEVTVTDSKGKTIAPANYDVTCSDVNVGPATAEVKFKGDFYDGTMKQTFEILPKKVTPTVTLSAKSYTYNGKVQTPDVTVKDGNTVLKKGTDYTVSYGSGRKNAGTYKVKVTLKGNYSGSKTVSYRIKKAANPMKVKAKTLKVSYSDLTKKKQTFGIAGALGFTTKAIGTKTYMRVTGSQYITVSRITGQITVKKGLKKGTHMVKIRVRADGNGNYKAVTKTVKVKLEVK